MAAHRERVLEYSQPESRELARGWRWVAYALTAVPVAAVVSVHLVYTFEWFVNGEPPIPPHHGPGNRVEHVLYWASHILLVAFGISLSGIVLLPVVALVNGISRATLVLFLPAAAWLASFLLLVADPVGAIYFWID